MSIFYHLLNLWKYLGTYKLGKLLHTLLQLLLSKFQFRKTFVMFDMFKVQLWANVCCSEVTEVYRIFLAIAKKRFFYNIKQNGSN